MSRFHFKIKKRFLWPILFLLIGLGAYAGLKWQSQRLEQQRLELLRQKSSLLNEAFEAHSQAAFNLMREISLGEQVVSRKLM